MNHSIPLELIDALPRHFIVAAKAHMGKSKLIRALGNEVFKKYNLESWTYVGETGTNTGSIATAATSMPESIEAADMKNMLYMYDGYMQSPKDAEYGASIYSAMVMSTNNFDGQPTAESLRVTQCACPLGTKVPTVYIKEIEGYGPTLQLKVDLYSTADINGEPLSAHMVKLYLDPCE